MSVIPPILHQHLAGRYVLKREIGRGGSATVYLAHDVRHERLVAIKVLHPELSHALGAQRFIREIKLTASLQHPHILAIHDSGEADDQLFYVMPYVEGDSLRQRLDASARLSVDETVRIGREIASALDYAHERGVVHRDIKPENILLSGGHAVLADFGIARAIDRASGHITRQGTITGTPAYMSPEQARDRAFDGRSDVYSLACVLYEAIAGVPPHVGDTLQQLLAQRVATAPPLMRQYRHDVPPAIDAVIAKALSISPQDRYADAADFSAALDAAIEQPGEVHPRATRRRIRSPLLWAACGVLMLAVAAATPKGRGQIDLLTGRVDSTAYAVVPFQYVGAPAPASEIEQASAGMYDAMHRWNGLHLASDISVADAIRHEEHGATTLADVSRIARSVHAGRAVWGRVRVTRDSLVLRAGVYDALTGESLREVTRVERPGTTSALAEVDYQSLVAELLRSPNRNTLSPLGDRGTASYAAWQAFDRGAGELARWDLPAAAASLESAVAADPGYPHANLWLAQLRFMRDAAPQEWTTPLLVAERRRNELDPREQLLADALVAISKHDHPAACRSYATLHASDSLDALAWLGLSLCQMRDETVVRSRASRTGWAFRSSSENMWRAVARLLEIAPEAFSVIPFETLRHVFPVEHNVVRSGIADGERFLGIPELSGDTLAYAPMSTAEMARRSLPARYDAALHHNRERMLGLLEQLARSTPESPDVFEALALMLETNGEIAGTPGGRYTALSALERARMLATQPGQQLRLAATDVRLHLKLGDLARSANLADSILGAHRNPTAAQAAQLEGLAAYAGRASLAARYRVLAADRDEYPGLPPIHAAEPAMAELLMRAALGICDDSLAILTRSVDRTIMSYVGATRRGTAHDRLLERAFTLAAPCGTAASSFAIASPQSPFARLEQLILRNDARRARRAVDSMRIARSSQRPGALSVDYIVIEAWMHDALGDPRAAADRLDLSLTAMPTLSTWIVTEPAMAAGVGRAMAYRADLASRLGDPSAAAQWASRVLTVWAHADADLGPTITRMRGLAMEGRTVGR